MAALSSHTLVTALKAAAEPTRLRILALLQLGPMTVKDLTRVLGQSQPRLSRHLKLLAEAQLIDRAPEGSWVFFHLEGRSARDGMVARVLSCLDAADPVLARDRQRVEAVKREQETAAQSYFASHAAEWDRIRSLHVDEAEVEAAVAAALRNRKADLLVDLGTGTGRMLELLADRYARGIGFDLNPAMLSYARSKLGRAGIRHAQVRQGDILDVPLADGAAGIVVMHQILHFLADPERAVQEARRILAPGGTLLVVDFAPHNLEFVRETYAHARLGFADAQMRQWLAGCGLIAGPATHLHPSGGEARDKLTVSIWAATAPAAGTARSAAKLENAT